MSTTFNYFEIIPFIIIYYLAIKYKYNKFIPKAKQKKKEKNNNNKLNNFFLEKFKKGILKNGGRREYKCFNKILKVSKGLKGLKGKMFKRYFKQKKSWIRN